MLKTVSGILIGVLAILTIILAICSPTMRQMPINCPDVSVAQSILTTPAPFSCLSIHVTGLTLFQQVIISESVLLFFLLVWLFVSLLLVIKMLLPTPLRLSAFVDDFTFYIERVHYRWLAKSHTLY